MTRSKLVLSLLLATAAHAHADVVVGIVAPLSGQLAAQGQAWKEALEAYQKSKGDTVAGERVRFVYKDLPDVNPAKARAVAQELVLSDKVQYLGGFVYTPNAVAASQVATLAEVPMVIFNAAGVGINDKSPFVVRVSYTQPQLTIPAATFLMENGWKRVATLVSDYASGTDVEKTFEKAFTSRGGQVVSKIRVPLDNFDFGPFMQTIKAAKPDAIVVFTPGGAISIGAVKAYKENGLDAAGIKFLGLAGEVDEAGALKALGKQALGVYSSNFYNPTSESPQNKEFRADFSRYAPGVDISPIHTQAWEGAHLIYQMIAATKGRKDGKAAMKAVEGMKWIGPRGEMLIEPGTRDLVQSIHIRQVVEVDGKAVNKGIRTFERQPDWSRKE
jgi:branched-chain amino acid transport system substrate-binding protein